MLGKEIVTLSHGVGVNVTDFTRKWEMSATIFVNESGRSSGVGFFVRYMKGTRPCLRSFSGVPLFLRSGHPRERGV